jgi:hypothetical protein
MRDGYPVYGRRDPDGALPSDLDVAGGHDRGGYHYHVNAQTSPRSGETQWFLTTGMFRGTPGSCVGC